jgi:hypothetical protein
MCNLLNPAAGIGVATVRGMIPVPKHFPVSAWLLEDKEAEEP